MAPTPITATHKLALRINVGGLIHVQNLFVDAVASGDSTGFDLVCQASANLALSAAIAMWIAVVQPFYYSSITGAGWTLYAWSDPNYVPVSAGTLAFTGSAGSAYVPANEITLFFRDSLQRAAKITFLETSFQTPYKNTDPSALSGAAAALVGSFIGNTAADLGSFVKSRGDGNPDRYISLVSALNRRVRRRRGLA